MLCTYTTFIVAAYIIPSDDPHLSEYVPAAYMRRGYLTDFHGSAGTALVLADRAGDIAKDVEGGDGERSAYLWTDSRLVVSAWSGMKFTCLLAQKARLR